MTDIYFCMTGKIKSDKIPSYAEDDAMERLSQGINDADLYYANISLSLKNKFVACKKLRK